MLTLISRNPFIVIFMYTSKILNYMQIVAFFTFFSRTFATTERTTFTKKCIINKIFLLKITGSTRRNTILILEHMRWLTAKATENNSVYRTSRAELNKSITFMTTGLMVIFVDIAITFFYAIL